MTGTLKSQSRILARVCTPRAQAVKFSKFVLLVHLAKLGICHYWHRPGRGSVERDTWRKNQHGKTAFRRMSRYYRSGSCSSVRVSVPDDRPSLWLLSKPLAPIGGHCHSHSSQTVQAAHEAKPRRMSARLGHTVTVYRTTRVLCSDPNH